MHAIDTRGVVNTLGCTECKCDLYNVTEDGYHRPLRKDYIGGLSCCYDGTQCQLKEGVLGEKKILYLKYTVYWMDWEKTIVPVKVYILDVTDTGERSVDQSSSQHHVGCHVEYDVPQCSAGIHSPGDCIDIREANMAIPQGGNVIYGVGHQHTGGAGLALYGQDGREICTSLPLYGEGRKPGNETGYVVGMSTCYPELGSVQINGGETLKLQSKYSKERSHTGVMGLFYLLIADPMETRALYSHQSEPTSSLLVNKFLPAGLLIIFVLLAGLSVAYSIKKGREDGYEYIIDEMAQIKYHV